MLYFILAMFDVNEDNAEVYTTIDLTDTKTNQQKKNPKQINTDSSSCYFNLAEIVESLYHIGLVSCGIWENIIKRLKSYRNFLADAELLKLYTHLSRMTVLGRDWISALVNDETDLTLYNDLKSETKTSDEMLVIFAPLLNEKSNVRVSYKSSKKLFLLLEIY